MDDSHDRQGPFSGSGRYESSRWNQPSQSASKPQPLLSNPPPLLPCPPHTNRRFPPQQGTAQWNEGADGVVQLALNKAMQREKEECKRYEESRQSGDDKKSVRGSEEGETESAINNEEYEEQTKESVPNPRGPPVMDRRSGDYGKFNREQPFNRGYERRDNRNDHMFGSAPHMRASNLPPRLQKQQQQQQYHHGSGFRANNQPVTLFEPQFGSHQGNRQYSRDSGKFWLTSLFHFFKLF